MKVNKLSRKEREFFWRRQEILESALELFSEKGFHNITMHDIAKQSEFAVGTIYKFFSNKEELYKALVLEKSGEFHSSLIDALDRGKNEMDKIKGFVETLIKVFMKNLKFVRIYASGTSGASYSIRSGMDAEVKEMYEQTMLKLAGVFKKGISKRLFNRFDPYILAVVLNGTTLTLLFQSLDHADKHPFDVDTIMKMFFESILKNPQD